MVSDMDLRQDKSGDMEEVSQGEEKGAEAQERGS